MTCPVCARDDADNVHSLVTCEGCDDEPCDGCDCHDRAEVPEIVKQATRYFIDKYREALEQLG